jgi:hypothetical protein
LRFFAVAACAIVAPVAAEILLPAHAVYHSGWYNVALIALLVVLINAGRRMLLEVSQSRARLAILAVICGATLTAVAGVANGLFAPDDREVVGAPGQRVRVEALGTLIFPFVGENSSEPRVMLERPLHAALEIGARPRYAGSFIMRTLPRQVVYVEARDLHGSALTITQPDGTVFLSPVLLMQHRQTIAGMDVPFDSFNVPAAGRIVKAILFTPAQAAMLAHGGAPPGQGAVLFAVDDERDRPLAHSIALSASGASVAVGDLRLRATIAAYPQVDVISAPNIVAVAIGTLLAIAGLALVLVPRDDRANVSHDDAALRELDAF